MDRAELARRLGAEPAVGEPPRRTIIATADPESFRMAFAAAVAAGGPVFLADPHWGARERAQFNALVDQADAGAADGRGWLMIPTGGSSGRIKLARHDEETIGAAVAGFAAFFGGRVVNALGLLPLHHVSGLMAWLRCVLTGGRYVDGDWAQIAAGEYPEAGDGTILSLVPTQLARLADDPAALAWLRGFKAVFIGGGPTWPGLIDQAAEARLPLAFSYGMTETAAMVTALRPAEFLAGERGAGKDLPHARVDVAADGLITIRSASLFRGYWPESMALGEWSPGDVGAWDKAGNLQVAGRRDALIITGGEKVNPTEVEDALRGAGAPADLAVIGLPDERWGEIVVACYRGPARIETEERAWGDGLAERLARFKRPKHFVAIDVWPVSAAGKLDRSQLRELARTRIGRATGG